MLSAERRESQGVLVHSLAKWTEARARVLQVWLLIGGSGWRNLNIKGSLSAVVYLLARCDLLLTEEKKHDQLLLLTPAGEGSGWECMCVSFLIFFILVSA